MLPPSLAPEASVALTLRPVRVHGPGIARALLDDGAGGLAAAGARRADARARSTKPYESTEARAARAPGSVLESPSSCSTRATQRRRRESMRASCPRAMRIGASSPADDRRWEARGPARRGLARRRARRARTEPRRPYLSSRGTIARSTTRDRARPTNRCALARRSGAPTPGGRDRPAPRSRRPTPGPTRGTKRCASTVCCARFPTPRPSLALDSALDCSYHSRPRRLALPLLAEFEEKPVSDYAPFHAALPTFSAGCGDAARGARGLRARARADRQSRRAGVPGAAAGRASSAELCARIGPTRPWIAAFSSCSKRATMSAKTALASLRRPRLSPRMLPFKLRSCPRMKRSRGSLESGPHSP